MADVLTAQGCRERLTHPDPETRCSSCPPRSVSCPGSSASSSCWRHAPPPVTTPARHRLVRVRASPPGRTTPTTVTEMVTRTATTAAAPGTPTRICPGATAGRSFPRIPSFSSGCHRPECRTSRRSTPPPPKRHRFAPSRRVPAPLLAKPAWTFLGPKTVGGRVVDAATDPQHKGGLYVATSTAGVWHSTDSGASFTSVWPTSITHAMGALAIAPDGTLYAGTGETNPGGGSITYGGDGHLPLEQRRHRPGSTSASSKSGTIGRIVVDPTNPQPDLGGGQRQPLRPRAANAASTCRPTAARPGRGRSRRPTPRRARQTSPSTPPTPTTSSPPSGTTCASPTSAATPARDPGSGRRRTAASRGNGSAPPRACRLRPPTPAGSGSRSRRPTPNRVYTHLRQQHRRLVPELLHVQGRRRLLDSAGRCQRPQRLAEHLRLVVRAHLRGPGRRRPPLRGRPQHVPVLERAPTASRPSAAALHADQHIAVWDTHQGGDVYIGNDGGLYASATKGASWTHSTTSPGRSTPASTSPSRTPAGSSAACRTTGPGRAGPLPRSRTSSAATANAPHQPDRQGHLLRLLPVRQLHRLHGRQPVQPGDPVASASRSSCRWSCSPATRRPSTRAATSSTARPTAAARSRC